ncbi:MAG: LysE family translocator [Alphaproteobacteria bacterium]
MNIPLILAAGLIASVSPGPATLAIAGTSMERGRVQGVVIALGIFSGSITWSVSAAAGIGALMLVNLWVFEVIRYFGAGYLLFLAFQAARGALSDQQLNTRAVQGRLRRVYLQGLLLHLTNPKAVLFFGSIYTIGIPPGAQLSQLLTVMVSLALISFSVFVGYALLFSTPMATKLYLRARRWFQAVFAVGFAAAGLKILTARLTD